MPDMSFFREIGQSRITPFEEPVFNPTFTYDASATIAAFLTPLSKLEAALPSRRLLPLRATPAHGVTAICTFEQREADLGPHGLMVAGIPVTLDEQAPVLRGLLRQTVAGPTIFVTHLLVDSPRAALFYHEVSGLPAQVATITFERVDGGRLCRVTADGRRVLELGHLIPAAQPAIRWRVQMLGRRANHLLRSEMLFNVRQLGRTHDSEELCVELGDHPVATELRGQHLSRLLDLRYMPAQQSILSAPIESIPLG